MRAMVWTFRQQTALQNRLAMSLSQYARFLLVGGFVGLITLGARELVGRVLIADNAAYYSVSVLIAYALGIALSYALNRRHTFNLAGGSSGYSDFALFALIALGGALSTWMLSLALRYGAHLEMLLGRSSATVAFALATLLSSLITYPLNAQFVFRRSSSAVETAP
jgi:putative flippase GtrA